MATLEDRVGHLEGRMVEQSLGIAELKDSVSRMDAGLSDSIARLDSRVSDSIAHLDVRLSDSVARVDHRMTRQFVWLVGMLVTVLAAVVGGLLAR